MIFWFVLAATVAVSYSAHKKAKQAMRDAEDAAKGLLINKNSNIDFIPVIYGTRRVGGTRVFISTKDVSGGDENEYLYIALVVSEGEVESISDLKFDDIDAGDGRFSGLVDYNVHLGTNNQAADSLLQEAPDWTSSHQLKGVAYIALRLKYDQDAWNGIPNITALVQGRKLYDPRTQQTVFSNNPALCLYDYLTNTRYGKGLLPPVIDQTSIATAANECDQFEVTPYSGGSDIKIFQCNYVLKPEEKIIDNVRDILASCRGFLPFSNGKYSLKIDSASSSVKTFNTDNIIGGINIKGGDKSTTQNRNMVRFANADIDYQPDQAAYPDAGSTEDVTYLEENNDERLQETVELKSCTDYYIARDFARIITERSRNHLRVTFQTDSSGLELNIADVITVNHPTPDWGDKLFQVEEITLNPDMTANILAIEYDSSIYAYDESAVQKTYPDTNLPNPFSVSPPTNLTSTNSTAVSSDGSVIPSLTFNWTAPADSFVQKYEFQYKRESSILDHGFITDSHTENPDYGLITSSAGVTVDYGNVTDASTTGETVYTSVIVNSTQFVITGTVPDVNYNVRVRSINDLGVRSSFVDLSALVAGDTTPPSIPNSVAAAGGLKEITITWERPVEHDYSHVEVWEGIIASTLAASKIAIASGDNYTRTGLDYDSTRYYHLKSVDFSGNVSDFSSTVSATTLFVDSDAFSDSVTNLFAEAGAYGIEPVGTLPASGDFIGQIKFNSSTVALYRWTGTEWTDDIFTIEEASVNAASFANEIEPVSIVNSLPSPSGYTGPTMIFLTTDSQLYRYDSSVPE
ncbi:phage tail protein, partial [bacterium]|nr:phage tail protein [bacterium]